MTKGTLTVYGLLDSADILNSQNKMDYLDL